MCYKFVYCATEPTTRTLPHEVVKKLHSTATVVGFGIIGDEPLDSITRVTRMFASMGMQEICGADFLVYFCYPFVKQIG